MRNVIGASIAMVAACGLPADEDAVLAVEQLQVEHCFGFDGLNREAPLHDQGQTFTAPMSGHVTRIDMALQSATGSDIDLAIYEGEGFAGRVLGGQQVTPTPRTGSPTDILEYPLVRSVPVAEGRIYTIGLAWVGTQGNGGFCGSNSDPYPGGMTWNNNAPLPQQDSQFRVFIVPE